MNKTLSRLGVTLLIAALAATSASAALVPYELEDYGQKTFSVYSTTTAPVVDGVVNAGEYGDPIAVYNLGDDGAYWSGDDFSDAELAELIPGNISMYMTYDDTYVYIALTCEDSSHMTPLSGTGVWDGDYMEWDILLPSDSFDDLNNRIRYALGADNTGDVTGYYANIPDYANPVNSVNEEIKDLTKNNVTVNGNLTTYEAKLTWAELLGTDGAPDSALYYVQLGCSSEALADQSDYEAYLGVFRCAPAYDEDTKAEIANNGGAGSFAFNVLNFVGEAPAPETEAEVVDVPAAEDTATEAVAPQTFDMGVVAAVAAVVSAAGYAVSKKR